MTEFHDSHDPFSEVEALVRSARDFVEASDDLRPRVLEAARDERKQLSIRQRLGKAAALVMALGMFLALIREEAQVEPSHLAGSSGGSPLVIRPDTVLDQHESAWEMVDSLTELRKRQAVLFRLSL